MNKTLKAIRISKGYTQKAISELLKISIRQYQRYETGTVIPSVSIAKKISNILNVKIEDIFNE